MNTDNNEIGFPVKKFTESLWSDELKDIGVDISEIGLDMLFEDGTLLEGIPFVKTGVAVAKAAGTIHARFELKKQLAFLECIQNGEMEAEGVEKRKRAYENNEAWFRKEVENLVIYLSRYSTVNKARIQAELYIDLVNGKIKQPLFAECLDILDRLFLSDIPHLIEICTVETEAGVSINDTSFFQGKCTLKFDSIRCGRLASVGLLHQLHPMSFGFSIDNYYLISETGKYMCEVISRTFHKDKEIFFNQ